VHKILEYYSLNKKKSAFSLIEVSIVIVIIGLLIFGVIGSKHLVAKSRLSTARSLTNSSPISSVRDNALWLESSLDELAFSDNPEASDGDSLSSWKDNSYNQNKSTITAVGTGPTYANTINNVQAVQFAGSASNYLQISDAAFLNNTDYTIFVLEKREANSSDNYFIGDGTDTTANQTLILGYSTDAAPIHSQGTGNNYTAGLESYLSYSGKPRLFTFMSSSTNGKKMYINGVLAAEDVDTTQLSGITTLPIGMSYNGEIGEIAIFTRALKAVERIEIEDYMGKKWNNKVNRDSVSGGSCTSGTITSTGCDSSCVVSVNGSSVTTLAADASDNFICDGTGYNSGSTTQEFTCTGGSLTPSTPATSECVDNLGCASGYLEVSNACAQGCTTTAIVGSSSTVVAAGTTSVTCDDTGYDSTFTFSACSAGDNVTGTCGCAAGYNPNGGVCEQQCTLTAAASSLPADVTDIDSGAVEYDCSTYGAYTGTVTFDACNNGATLTTVAGSCTEVVTCSSDGDTVDTTTVPGDTIHIFTTVGATTLVCTQAVTAQILVIGGGASGGKGYGQNGGGGGGAGGMVYSSSYSLTSGSYNITVGDGGDVVTSTGVGVNGDNSEFDLIIAYGGGGGGYKNGGASTPGPAASGGSGGGGPFNGSGEVSTQDSQTNETYHKGNSGGSGSPSVGYITGGGGGAGGVGQDATSTDAGDGGIGFANDIMGTSTTYAAGGGGGRGNGTGLGSGGSSIGGNGGDSTTTTATDGNANTGSGGGGSANASYDSGGGGSGIVIVRYTTP